VLRIATKARLFSCTARTFGVLRARSGDAFAVDHPRCFVAHPDISLLLWIDEAVQRRHQTLRANIRARPGLAAALHDIAGERSSTVVFPLPMDLLSHLRPRLTKPS
jgi:hypothetical protein